MSEQKQEDTPQNGQGARAKFVKQHLAEAFAVLISLLALLVSGIGPYQEYYLDKSALGIQLVSFDFSGSLGECSFEVAHFNTGNKPSAILDVVFEIEDRTKEEGGFHSDLFWIRSSSDSIYYKGLVVEPGAISVSRVPFQGCNAPLIFQTAKKDSRLNIRIKSMDNGGNRFETVIQVGGVAHLSEAKLEVDLFLRGKTNILGNFMYGQDVPSSGKLYITRTGEDDYNFEVSEIYNTRFN